jgi:hypothetical protein
MLLVTVRLTNNSLDSRLSTSTSLARLIPASCVVELPRVRLEMRCKKQRASRTSDTHCVGMRVLYVVDLELAKLTFAPPHMPDEAFLKLVRFLYALRNTVPDVGDFDTHPNGIKDGAKSSTGSSKTKGSGGGKAADRDEAMNAVSAAGGELQPGAGVAASQASPCDRLLLGGPVLVRGVSQADSKLTAIQKYMLSRLNLNTPTDTGVPLYPEHGSTTFVHFISHKDAKRDTFRQIRKQFHQQRTTLHADQFLVLPESCRMDLSTCAHTVDDDVSHEAVREHIECCLGKQYSSMPHLSNPEYSSAAQWPAALTPTSPRVTVPNDQWNAHHPYFKHCRYTAKGLLLLTPEEKDALSKEHRTWTRYMEEGRIGPNEVAAFSKQLKESIGRMFQRHNTFGYDLSVFSCVQDFTLPEMLKFVVSPPMPRPSAATAAPLSQQNVSFGMTLLQAMAMAQTKGKASKNKFVVLTISLSNEQVRGFLLRTCGNMRRTVDQTRAYILDFAKEAQRHVEFLQRISDASCLSYEYMHSRLVASITELTKEAADAWLKEPPELTLSGGGAARVAHGGGGPQAAHGGGPQAAHGGPQAAHGGGEHAFHQQPLYIGGGEEPGAAAPLHSEDVIEFNLRPPHHHRMPATTIIMAQ